MQKWYCTICYHGYEAASSPVSCPRCTADRTSLLQLGDGTAASAADSGTKKPQTLEEVRDLARKQVKGICAVYPQCDGLDERICQREPYGKPIRL